MDGSRGVRISDADRERTAQRLQTAMAEGRISVAELDERLALVYAARYESELGAPLADLPPVDHPQLVPLAGVATEPVVLRSGMSAIKRKGQWVVPPRLKVQSAMGSAKLDFCDTTLPLPVIDIDVALGAGSATLLIPDGATADVDGAVATMGSVKSKVGSKPQQGVPHFRVHGYAGMGSVKVRYRYRFGSWRF